jgi:ABC-type nitrate/sulfonate/bicarbonate transport system substrate-binding protein
VSQEKLRIATSSYHIGHAIAPMAALEKGYFKEEGFENFELLTEGLIPSFVEKVALSTSMKERGIDMVLGAQIPSVLTLHSQGEDLSIVFGWRFVPQADWYARPGINSFADLKGKKIGIRDKGSTGPTRVLWNQIKKAGLDPDEDVVWVHDRIFAYHRTRDHVDALKEGKVDCMQSSPPFSEELEKMGCTAILSSRKLFPKGRPMGVIAARKRVIEERGVELRAFFRGIIRGFWAERNPENFSYLADLEKRLRAASPSADERALRLLTSPDHLEVRPLPVDGQVPIEGLREIADEMKDNGELPSNYNVDTALIGEPVRDAFEGLIARKEIQPEWQRMQRVVERLGF